MAEAAESDDKKSEGKDDAAAGEASVKLPFNWKVIAVVVALIAGIAAAVVFSFQFVESERARQLQEWQIRLGIVADSRSADVNEWIDGNFATMRELAQNESLQIYITELEMAEGDKEGVTDEAAQATYLRNLLVATAERTGFKAPSDAGEVSANVEKAGVAGLALVDANGQPIVVTPTMPPLTPTVRSHIAKALGGEPTIIPVFLGATNLPTIGFALPILGIQSDEGSEGIGAVIGMRIVDKELFDRLKQPGETETTAETYLVRAGKGIVEYLSPLADGTEALKRSLDGSNPELAAAFALDKPGGFGAKRDYAGTEVLIVSRAIAEMPWVLVRKISRAEALEATENRLNTILGVFVAIIVIVTITIIAVWRHGTSVRATEAAEKFRISSLRFENMSKFMRVVTNSQPTGIVAVDGTTTFTFSNAPAAAEAGIAPEDMMGKKMAAVMGPVKAKAFADINDKILKNFEDAENEGVEDPVATIRESHIQIFGEGDDIEVVKSDHIPLRGDRDYPPGVLMVIDDITELTHERRRSEHMTRQLINTLVSIVDRRDPYSSQHSVRIAEVARALAKDMDADAAETNTVDIAGSLMGVGKIFIPTAVLAKGDNMTDDERTLVDSSYSVSADLLVGVPFDGPIVDTIREIGEHWDGSGPLGKAGEDILHPSRIVAVAKAFVELVSAGATRDGLSFEDASNRLLQQSGTRFDRKPVTALINLLENHGGAEQWVHFRDRPDSAGS
jgi:HD-GYP domain-containing protein (c-di-GMP phosphodiesterase class II)